MGAVARQVAFEQDEAVDFERRRCEPRATLLEVAGGRGALPLVARQGDVRVEGAMLGLQARGDAGAVDLGGELGDRLFRLDPGP